MKLLEKLRGLFGPRKKPGRPAGAKKPAPQKKPLKIAGPDAKLTAAEKRRVKRSIQKAQRDGKIPRDAVQTIPYRELFPDGLMQVNDKLFTKTLRFSDINYELAQPEDKEQTFDGLCDFYNALDSSMWAQMSFLNLRANLIDYRKSVTVPGQGDGCDDVRRELETILQAQLAKGNNGLIKRKYFTFGIEADSGQAARPRVERIEADLRNHLKNMGVRSEPLSGYDRLEVLHGIFHPDGREKLRFNWDAVVNTGLSTKPFIAPSSFDFRGGRTFKIGGMWGAASFLQIGASQLNDRVLSDFLNLDCSQIVTIHIKAVNQQEAIKTIKRKLTDIEKTKIEEQKKAVRSGYDMDVLPPDLITYAGEAQTLLNSLQSRDERMFLATVLIVNLAPTRGQLENDVFQAASVAQKHNCALKRLDWQQEQGLMSSLPLGLNQIEIQRGLTTSSLAIFVPFTTEELFMDGEALYYGINALSSNLIMADRKRLKNPNGLFLGVPGSGKSFSAKREIANAFLTTKDDIMAEVQNVKTAIHEITHATLHNYYAEKEKEVPPEQRKDQRTREVEAESVAYTVCQHYGIETSDYSFGYIAGWSSDKQTKELKASLATIRETAAGLIDSIDGAYQEIVKGKEQVQVQAAPVQEAPGQGEPDADPDTFNIYQLKGGDALHYH